MIINVVNVPIVMLLVSGVRAITQWFDRGCTCRRERTKKKTQKAWEDLYTGPEFLIEFRYSQVFQFFFKITNLKGINHDICLHVLLCRSTFTLLQYLC